MDMKKLMILDARRLVEFDEPSELLKKVTWLLYSLVQWNADKEELIVMAHGTAVATTEDTTASPSSELRRRLRR